MPDIQLIAAMSKNRVIGRNNSLPWHLPDDLKHFKAVTLDRTIIMGRNTWQSLPGILPRREHVVLSSDPAFVAEGAITVRSVAQALQQVPVGEPALVVGGAQLYRQLLPRASSMLLTMVDTEIEGDAVFPPWLPEQWRETSREHHAADAKHAFAFDFVTLQRVAADP